MCARHPPIIAQGEIDPQVLPNANTVTIGEGGGLANSSGTKAYGSF